MSTHAVQVVKIDSISNHPNADKLDLIQIGGWQVVSAKGEFSLGDKAVYIEPDYMVPLAHPLFKFLDKNNGKTQHRLKAIKLRGEVSYGLLVKLPSELSSRSVGDDVMSDLGIERYVQPVKSNSKIGHTNSLPDALKPRLTVVPVFDLENLQKHPDVFTSEDVVVVTEKLDGTNVRYVFHNGKMYIGSRRLWLRTFWTPMEIIKRIWKRLLGYKYHMQHSQSVYTNIPKKFPQIEQWCRDNPDTILIGEIYGCVQSLTYGLSNGQVTFAAFAAMKDGKWLETMDLFDSLALYKIPCAPLLYCGKFDKDLIKTLAEQDSSCGPAGHMREGVVVTSVPERVTKVGRNSFKLISNRFWLSEA